jgi:MYXO-CTERM domain-containing protein
MSSTTVPPQTSTSGDEDTDTDGGAVGEDPPGCGCRSGSAPGGLLLIPLLLLLRRRRAT